MTNSVHCALVVAVAPVAERNQRIAVKLFGVQRGQVLSALKDQHVWQKVTVSRYAFNVRYKVTILRACKVRWSICVEADNPLSTSNANAEACLIHIVKVGWQNAF